MTSEEEKAEEKEPAEKKTTEEPPPKAVDPIDFLMRCSDGLPAMYAQMKRAPTRDQVPAQIFVAQAVYQTGGVITLALNNIVRVLLDTLQEHRVARTAGSAARQQILLPGMVGK